MGSHSLPSGKRSVRRYTLPVLAAAVLLTGAGVATANAATAPSPRASADPWVDSIAAKDPTSERDTAAKAVPASISVSVMSFNVCGGVCHQGKVAQIAGYVADTAVRRKASVVLLQELCYSQYRRIKSLVAPHGYTAYFAKGTSSGACDNDDARYGKDFGVAILVRGAAWDRVVKNLPTPAGYEKRVLLGVTATIAGRRTFVATVHLSPSARAGLNGQLSALAAYLAPKAAQPSIVGGDFNALPDNPGLNAIYSPAVDGTGRFTELDQTNSGHLSRLGEPTFDAGARKIDYIFVSRAYFGSPGATSFPTSMSDHRVYIGTARSIG